MARVAVTPIALGSPYKGAPAGVAEKVADAAEFNSFVNDGRTFLVVRNQDAAATHTVKLKSSSGVQIGATVTVPKSQSVCLGPFPVFEQFGSVVDVDCSSAELTLLAVSHPNFASAVR